MTTADADRMFLTILMCASITCVGRCALGRDGALTGILVFALTERQMTGVMEGFGFVR
jgi:hypothetical protein